MNELLTVPEAARLMRVGTATVYSLVQAGDIPSVRVRRFIRIPKQALLNHLETVAAGSVSSIA